MESESPGSSALSADILSVVVARRRTEHELLAIVQEAFMRAFFRGVLCVGLLLLVWTSRAHTQTPDANYRVQSNVVFGMYSGLALSLDIYTPFQTNGYGIVFVQGGGFYSPPTYAARAQKDSPAALVAIRPMLDAGYTAFVVNHRTAPRFQHPAALEDVQRAIRFVRTYAAQCGINPDRIGGAGSSSGATLMCLAALLHGEGDQTSNDPVSRVSAAVQAFVGFATPVDLGAMKEPFAAVLLTLNFGVPVFSERPPDSATRRLLNDASPLYRIDNGAPPLLLVHGESDTLVPIAQAEAMAAALQKVGTPHRLLRIPGGTHDELNVPSGPNIGAEVTAWFDRWLKASGKQ